MSGGLLSVKWDVLGRYARFAQSLISSPSREINILARVVTRDIRSTTARNLRLLEKETDGLTWLSSSLKIKEAVSKKVVTVPESDAWRVPYLGKLLEQRDMLVYQGEKESQEVVRLQEMIDSLCTN